MSALVPSVNLDTVQISNIDLGVNISGTDALFTVSADLALATGGLPCTSPTNAQCLRTVAPVSASVHVVTSPTPEVDATFSLALSGVWMDPLGMTNFALLDPSIGFGLAVPTSGTPTLRHASFGLHVLYKSSGSWPAALLARGATWPPDLSAGAKSSPPI